MKIMRKLEMEVENDVIERCEWAFKIGDQIQIDDFYTATCQKVGKRGAIFMFDQYLDKPQAMNIKDNGSSNAYEDSDLRKYLKGFAMNSMFDRIRDRMIPFKNGDLLRIPTAEEMFGPEEAHEYYEPLTNKNQWLLMKNPLKRVAFAGEDLKVEYGWLQNRHKKRPAQFAQVNKVGNMCISYDPRAGVRVVFRLGN